MAAQTADVALTRTVSADGITMFGGSIVINGVDISRAVRGMTISAEVGKTPTLVLTLVAHELNVGGQTAVQVDEETATTLRALGWSPPEPTA
jgi:hypothetical protein